ncbi:DNA polymerase I [Hyphomicrobium sp. ghe19]|nr:DNA polymerase I [Hyphomicrobium sp. ghe19]
MITIWSTAQPKLVSETFGRMLKGFRPNVPKHQFHLYKEDAEPPVVPTGEVCLVAGAKPLAVLQKAGLAPKGRTITSLREKPLKSPNNGSFLMTFDPHSIANDPPNYDILLCDLRLADRLQRTGSTEVLAGNCKWVPNFSELIEGIASDYAQTGKPVDVTVDTETMGFYPWYPDRDIVSISFTHKRGEAHVLYLGDLPGAEKVVEPQNGSVWDQVNWLLTSDRVKIRAANGKYDMIWIAEKWGIECTNFSMDTMLVGSLLDENRSNSLNLHAKLFTPYGGYDDAFNQTQDKGAMEKIPPEKLLPYAGGDTIAAQDVADTLKADLLHDDDLTRFYVTILHPAARAFEKVERRGLVIDKEKFEVLGDDLRKTIKQTQDVALGLLPQKMRIKYKDRIEDQIAQGKNPLLPSILQEFFFTPHGLNLKPYEVTPKLKNGQPVPSMKKSHLRQFEHVPTAKAMVAALTELDAASKTLSTFVEGFLKHLRPDMRLHPTYFLAHGDFDGYDDDAGTVTGRLSAKDPAIQTVPKKTKWAKRLRECFPSPPKKKLLSCDFSQGELKVVACVANEKTMLKAYEDGLDLHALTGAQMAQVDIKEFLSWKDHPHDKELAAAFEKHRGNAKPCNFGLLYGMSAEGFQKYAWASYNIMLSIEEATEMRNAFFTLYPGLLGYHDDMRKLVKTFKMVRTPLGRIRHLPTIDSWDRQARSSAERQAINSPIQGCLTDMMIWAIALLEDAYPGGELEIVAMIHDALIAYIPEGEEQLWAQRVTDVMSSLPFDKVGWKPQLKFTADAEAGPDLAHMSKIKLVA